MASPTPPLSGQRLALLERIQVYERGCAPTQQRADADLKQSTRQHQQTQSLAPDTGTPAAIPAGGGGGEDGGAGKENANREHGEFERIVDAAIRRAPASEDRRSSSVMIATSIADRVLHGLTPTVGPRATPLGRGAVPTHVFETRHLSSAAAAAVPVGTPATPPANNTTPESLHTKRGPPRMHAAAGGSPATLPAVNAFPTATPELSSSSFETPRPTRFAVTGETGDLSNSTARAGVTTPAVLKTGMHQHHTNSLWRAAKDICASIDGATSQRTVVRSRQHLARVLEELRSRHSRGALEADVVEDVWVMYCADHLNSSDVTATSPGTPCSPFAMDSGMTEQVKEIINHRIDMLLRGEDIASSFAHLDTSSLLGCRSPLGTAAPLAVLSADDSSLLKTPGRHGPMFRLPPPLATPSTVGSARSQATPAPSTISRYHPRRFDHGGNGNNDDDDDDADADVPASTPLMGGRAENNAAGSTLATPLRRFASLLATPISAAVGRVIGTPLPLSLNRRLSDEEEASFGNDGHRRSKLEPFNVARAYKDASKAAEKLGGDTTPGAAVRRKAGSQWDELSEFDLTDVKIGGLEEHNQGAPLSTLASARQAPSKKKAASPGRKGAGRLHCCCARRCALWSNWGWAHWLLLLLLVLIVGAVAAMAVLHFRAASNEGGRATAAAAGMLPPGALDPSPARESAVPAPSGVPKRGIGTCGANPGACENGGTCADVHISPADGSPSYDAHWCACVPNFVGIVCEVAISSDLRSGS